MSALVLGSVLAVLNPQNFMNMCFCNFTDRYDVPTAVLVVHGDTHTEQCREPVEVIGCEGLEEIP